ncbi:ABC transporter substrate-binding protein [Oceanibacterium hippocampi]|uniref:Bacterial extracellular solute-binding protein n=1 Tax=Oceanibacterium hippocampi TaxID=745714 RepID=A0A1Y5TXC1_9PROT|nr:ABC transporter substrate-binding protein [Oceanibacterium hippocampi]SLN75685.1 Bacterial extracellular solute-binding protein [Oceanibacterium hippocampi]
MTRRRHIFSAVLTGAVLGLATLGTAVADEIAVSGSGGVVAEVNEKYFFPAFTEDTGWTIKQVGAEAKRMAEIEAMVRAGNTVWDVSEISASDYPLAVKKGLLEPIDYALVDPDNKLPEMARKEFGVVAASYSTVLVQRLDKNPDGKKMESWADFWDVETFPGPRSLRGRPEYNLEFALLAEGVAKEDLYKILSTKEGVERAFAKLDEIKEHIPVWWTSGAQSVQLLSDGEVFYSTTYNGRVGKLQESGIPAEIIWNGGALHVSHVSIVKGSKHIEKAHDYIRIRTTRPDLELEYLKVLPYPNFAPGLFDQLDEAQAKQMPTYPANAEMQFSANEEFWADNIDWINERWNEWLLE